jgi:hypothetical protein
LVLASVGYFGQVGMPNCMNFRRWNLCSPVHLPFFGYSSLLFPTSTQIGPSFLETRKHLCGPTILQKKKVKIVIGFADECPAVLPAVSPLVVGIGDE